MNKENRQALLTAVLVPILVALSAIGWLWWKHSHQPKPLPPLFKPTSQFAIGVNYPWRNYGGDFGATVWGSHDGVGTPTAQQEVENDFNFLASQNLNVVRWFIFCDGRGGLVFNKDGAVTGIDQYVLDDMTQALAIAHRHQIRLVFVLIDFNFAQRATWLAGQRVGGHRRIIEKPALTLAFHNNALAPILKAFGESPDIAAWEIINEPEWVMTEFPYWQTSKIGVQKMQLFVKSTADFIKQHAKQPVTLGSASLSGLDYWVGCDLDFLQFHSYPYLEKKNPLNIPAADLGYSQPIVLGEFPSYNTPRGTDQYFELMYRNGYVGALVWSYRASDKYSYLAKQLPAISAWLKAQTAKAKKP